ncbi:hypothetical protein HGRIS_002326 [Hohenbuehelia grisea]|uniref:BTB domain-containing protein n=1 Tax=Hohenbuehelia grisea TaxID=104357 RepID=A0ABR3JKV7_9AGAR
MEIQISRRFNGPEYDMTCRSSDNVLFKLNTKDIEMHSNMMTMFKSGNSKGGDGIDNSDKEVPSIALTETSSVLELLFQFMRNQPQPELTSITFTALLSLTVAAEKYQVYAVTDRCKVRLRECIPQHPLQVLDLAANHKYAALMDEAAPHTIELKLKDVQSILKPHVFNAWIRYHRTWMDLLHDAYTYQEPTRWHWEGFRDKVGVKAMDSPCEVWTEVWAKVAHRLAAKPESLLQVDDIFHDTQEVIGMRCMSCPKWIEDWHKEVKYQMSKQPKFSTFM